MSTENILYWFYIVLIIVLARMIIYFNHKKNTVFNAVIMMFIVMAQAILAYEAINTLFIYMTNAPKPEDIKIYKIYIPLVICILTPVLIIGDYIVTGIKKKASNNK